MLCTPEVQANRVTKPEAGHFAKAGVEAGRGLWEFRLAEGEEFTVGQSISVELFADVKKVDVTGTSKGKGFAGLLLPSTSRAQSHGNVSGFGAVQTVVPAAVRPRWIIPSTTHQKWVGPDDER